jgi:hypothetical protein
MMKRVLLITTIIFFAIAFHLYAQVDVVCILPKEYKNKTLKAKTYKDLITKVDTVLAQVQVKDTIATFSIDIKQTRMIFFPYGREEVFFYAEPGKNYKLIFPSYSPKTVADSVNPYFKPERVWAGMINPDTLNTFIINFNSEYNRYIDMFFYTIYQQGFHSKVDTFLSSMKKMFEITNNKFLNAYIEYKLAYLEFVAKKRDIRKITWDYYTHKKPWYYNDAYMDLFNEMYKFFFNLYAQTPEGKDIYFDITRGKSPYLIKQTLSKRYEFASDDTLKELVMLKGLFDGSFPSTVGAFRKLPAPQVFLTLDSIIIQTKIPEHKTIALDIKKVVKESLFSFKDTFKTLTYLDRDGNDFKFTDFKGKFAYIGLCDINNLPCLEQFALTERYAEHFKTVLDVYYIFPMNQKEKVENFFAKNNLKHLKFLFFKNAMDIKKLRVPSFPRYILTDPYGKIINETAPLPIENFNSYFTKILRKMN